jgi:putative ABC transport system permease protein
MPTLMGWRHIVRSLLRRRAAVDEMTEEIAFHIERQTRKYVDDGMPAAEARRRAALDFGGAARWREERSDVGMGRAIDRVIQDARYAVRTLAKQPAYTSVAVLTLGVAMGATTAAFTLVDRILLRPLPYPSADRLVSIQETSTATQRGFAFSFPNLLDFEREARGFESIAAFRTYDASIGATDAVLVNGASVYGDLARTFLLRPIVGRILTADDTREGAPPTVLLSYDLWQRRFGGDADVVGRTIDIAGGVPATIVGIAPRTLQYPEGALFWTGCNDCRRYWTLRTGINFEVVGRLAPGVSLAQARSEAARIGDALHQRFPKFAENQMTSATAIPLRNAQVDDSRRTVVGLAAAVACILLIACANLASANVARSAIRWHELSLRAALGASRPRLMVQLFVESLVLSAASAVVGLLGAWAAVRGVASVGGGHLARLTELGLDWRTVACAAVLSAFVAAVIGLIPASRMTAVDLRTTLARGARGSIHGGSRMRRTLIALDLAVSVVLLAGAGLALRSLQRVLDEPVGIDPRGVLTVEPQFREATARRYRGTAAALRYYGQAVGAIERTPGVVGAAISSTGPLGASWAGFVKIENAPDDPHPVCGYNVVGEKYFDVLGIPLLAGRVFTAADDSSAAHVAVINRAMAERFWPKQNPLGKRFRQTVMDSHADVWLTVVGVVADVKAFSLESDAFPIHYVSWRQRPERVLGGGIVVRSSLPASAVASSIRSAVTSVDESLPIVIQSIDERVRVTTESRRLAVTVLSGFAATALVLAALGIYGVLSYMVALRTREIGVRMALGADQRRVFGLVLGDVARPVATGIGVGLVVTVTLSRALRSLLYKLEPADPMTLGAVVVCLALLAVVASYIPARRAARVDPLITMRAD